MTRPRLEYDRGEAVRRSQAFMNEIAPYDPDPKSLNGIMRTCANLAIYGLIEAEAEEAMAWTASRLADPELQAMLVMLGPDRDFLLAGPLVLTPGPLGEIWTATIHTKVQVGGVLIVLGAETGKEAEKMCQNLLDSLGHHFREVRTFAGSYDLAVAIEDAWPKAT